MKDPLLQSLVYISRFYGQANSPDALVADLPLTDGLLSPFLLPRAAEKAGLQAKETKLELESISSLLFPVIALLKGGEACVVLSIDKEKGEAEVVLPQNEGSEQWIKLSELNAQYTGRLFLVKKRFRYDERSPEILKTRDGHWFWSTLWESRSIYRDVLIASILINIFAIAAPLFTRLVYDKIVPNLAFDSLWVLAIGITVIFVFDLILKLLRSYFIDLAGKKSDILISAKIFSRVMGIRMEAKPASVGAFARHLQEFESIREFFTSATVSSLIDLPFALLFLLIIYIMAGPLALVPLIAVLILVAYSFFIQRPLRKSIEEGSRLSSQKHANLIESLSGLETVKMFGAQSQFQYRWEEAVAHMSNWGLKSRRLTDSVQNTAGFLQQFVSVAMIVVGVYLIANGDLTMGGLIASTMLSGRAVGPMVQLALLSTRYNQAKSAMTVIEQLMAMPLEQEDGKRYIHRPVIRGKIEFDNVSFAYPNATNAALKNINLTINPGEKVAIIGRIGSGKTSLERLLMGLYRPTEGSVLIDDTDINQLHHIDIRRNIGCVPQDITLFFGSIRDNITLGRPLASDNEILLAAERAGVTAFTQHDAAGLEKQIGEGGHAISGGQRQAIAIARAFLSNPPVMIMDEPTSSMDNRSEMYIKRQLKNMSPEETLILITHKTSMLDIVDRLIVMEQGRIVADGPKDAVLKSLREGNVNQPKAGN
ncbi:MULTISPECIES: type I secretion system permease/ATPase [unclassified Photobacterium]|uniref:type I secretion system permease/ATPase n=1 Tax=unclassified Photobacterium TaxID=2628852 RepID=UPI001EDE97FD|nr:MULTISPECIES: type I secretion system permease/ATPase [unclassified Photobacterium]MCG3863756.1 type I secretion system permease/ATPase [Photobacterium sp. Ph6]MCG3875286.1 type I secretion system permease/ATPase [Photobacterium sp. Ph5]